MDEPLLQEEENRFTLFPIKHKDVYEMYQQQLTAFWTAEEIDYTADKDEWNQLDDDERYFIEHILAFFAGADGIVLENLLQNFTREMKWVEVNFAYTFQAMMENIHSTVYSLLIDTFIQDEIKKKKLFNAIDTIPCVKRKADWALKWISSDAPLGTRLIAFAVVEGLFFSGSFCSIFWLKSRGKMVKALGTSNELISRDEGLHTNFAVLLYSKIVNKLSQNEIENIFTEAVEIETEFICQSIPCRMIGMNSDLMTQYIKFVADRLITQLGYTKIYNVDCPFSFMKNISMQGKSNFFEKRVTEYQKADQASSATERKFDVEDLDNDDF